MYHVYDADKTIGVVKILSFDKKTPEQFKAACEDLLSGGCEKLVFDLRYNPGGDLDAITEVLDYLLPEGPIVHIVDAEGKEEVISSDANELDVPMMVLCNGSTASAGELFTCALQDYGKAEIVGTQTYGKGTMQTIISLPDNTGLGISYRMYDPPYSGRPRPRCYAALMSSSTTASRTRTSTRSPTKRTISSRRRLRFFRTGRRSSTSRRQADI